MRGYFISGTDTDIGKTVVGGALGLALQTSREVAVYKPVETGCAEGPGDALFYKRVLGLAEDLSDLCPVQLQAALAPSVAGKLVGCEISLGKIIAGFEALCRKYVPVLVEGAGGLCVPVRKAFMMLDLVKMLELPLILVVPNRLGMLNHALLSLNCARAYALCVQGIVVNDLSEKLDASAQYNVEALKELLVSVPIASMPYVEGLSVEKLRAVGAEVCAALEIL